MNSLKDKLKNKKITVGSWITLSDPAIAEIMAKSGLDWIVVDMEHSALSVYQAQEIIRVVNLAGIAPLVRVMENNPEAIKKFMDMGAHGVIVPRINTKLDAQKAVNAVKYPPNGTRGVGLFRAQNYSLDLKSYQKWNEEESIVIAQIEHIDSVMNIDSITSVQGIDGYIIGPYDLSASIGYPGEFDHPEVEKVFKILKKRIKTNSESWGFHVVEPDSESAIKKINEGYCFIAYGVDFLFFNMTFQTKINSLKNKIISNS